MTIGQLAEAASVGVETVRYYQRIGLLKVPPQPTSGYRRYSERDLERLRAIRRAKELGFSLEEVRRLQQLQYAPDCCGQVCDLTRGLLQRVKDKISELREIESALHELLQTQENSEHCVVLRELGE